MEGRLLLLLGEVEDRLEPVLVVLDRGFGLKDVGLPGRDFGLGAQDLDRGQRADFDGPLVLVQEVLGQLAATAG